MHTFFIDTTGRQCFRDYKMLYHKYLANNNLIILEQSINTISECIKMIQELIDKDPEIRDDFGIIIAVDIDYDKMLFDSISDQKVWLSFFIQEKLIQGLKAIAFNPKKFALLSIISNCQQSISETDFQTGLRRIFPWKTLENDSNGDVDDRVMNIIKSWDEVKNCQSIIDSTPMMKIIFTAIQQHLDSEVLQYNDQQLETYLNGLCSKAIEDFYEIIPEKGATFVLPSGNDEERNRILFSCASYIRQCVEENNYSLPKKYINFNLDFLKALENHRYCLGKVRDDLVYEEEEFNLYNENNQNEKLLNRVSTPDFHEIQATLPPKTRTSLFAYSPKKLLHTSNRYVEAVKNDVSYNRNTLEKWSESIRIEFQDYQKKFNHRVQTYPKDLFSEHKKDKTASNIRAYKEEIQESIAKKQIELSRQSLSSYEDADIDTAEREYRKKTDGEFERVNTPKLFSALFVMVAFLLSYIVPYFLVSPDSRNTIISIVIATLVFCIFLCAYFLITACVLNQHKVNISMALYEFSLIGQSILESLHQMYDDISKRFNVIMPDLTRRKLYLQWLNEEEKKLFEREEKCAVHRQKIEEEIIICKKLERHFGDNVISQFNDYEYPNTVPDLVQNDNFNQNYRVYMIMADEKISNYCSEVLA